MESIENVLFGLRTTPNPVLYTKELFLAMLREPHVVLGIETGSITCKAKDSTPELFLPGCWLQGLYTHGYARGVKHLKVRCDPMTC